MSFIQFKSFLEMQSGRVLKAAEKTRRKANMKAGAICRGAIRQGIRRRTGDTPSAPGKPPHSHAPKYLFKKAIQFMADPGRDYSVFVGPIIGLPKIMRIHETGGTFLFREWKRNDRSVTYWRVEDWEPRGKFSGRYEKTGRTVNKRYPKRPYVRPGFDKGKSAMLTKYREEYSVAFGSLPPMPAAGMGDKVSSAGSMAF
jgi:hypothetical protein